MVCNLHKLTYLGSFGQSKLYTFQHFILTSRTFVCMATLFASLADKGEKTVKKDKTSIQKRSAPLE